MGRIVDNIFVIVTINLGGVATEVKEILFYFCFDVDTCLIFDLIHPCVTVESVHE